MDERRGSCRRAQWRLLVAQDLGRGTKTENGRVKDRKWSTKERTGTRDIVGKRVGSPVQAVIEMGPYFSCPSPRQRTDRFWLRWRSSEGRTPVDRIFHQWRGRAPLLLSVRHQSRPVQSRRAVAERSVRVDP